MKEENVDDKDYEYVGLAFSGIRLYDWPSKVLEKQKGEPDKLVFKANVPKILIDTEETKKINDEIYEQCKTIINEVKDASSRNNVEAKNAAIEAYVDYSYTILKNILFIDVKTTRLNLRASGSSYDKIYYYDIKNDKELNISDVIKIFNIKVSDLNEESAESIEAIMPLNSWAINVNYKQLGKCPGIECINEKKIGLSEIN